MKVKFLSVVTILVVLFTAIEQSYGCDNGDGGPPPPPPNQNPVAALIAQPDHPATNANITLDGSSSYDPDGYITKCEWDWTNNGTYDYFETPGDKKATTKYDSPGTYTAKLRVTDNRGGTGIATCTVHVIADPIAIINVSSTNVILSDSVTFNGSSSYDPDGGNIAEYLWNFGDGTTSTQAVVSHTYINFGTYNVSLSVKDDEAVSKSAYKSVCVSPAPALTNPGNDATCQAINNIRLQWDSISGADYYKVYFGPNTTPSFVGNVNNNYYDTATLDPGQRYYWRLKIHKNNTTFGYSDMWYFTTKSCKPDKATNPKYDNGDGNVVLSWKADPNAYSHDIYFGTDPCNLEFMSNQVETSYNMGRLEPNLYYWRVDEVTDCNVTKGDVWNLTIHNVWYVNNAVSEGSNNGLSWSNAFYSLQFALDVADPNGDEIWVARGNEPYYPTERTDPCDANSVTFQLVKGVAIYGGFSGTEAGRGERDPVKNITILSGSIEKSSTSSVDTWTTPTGYSEPEWSWQSTGDYGPNRAIDDDLSWDYYAFCSSISDGQWSPFLEFTHSALDCNSVRVMVGGAGVGTLDVDVYDDEWHDAYEGDFTGGEWKAIMLDTIRTITKIRVRLRNDSEESGDGQIFEVDFGSHEEFIAENSSGDSGCYHVITCKDINNVTLEGFTITGGKAAGSDGNDTGAGIYCKNSNLTVRRCIISENTAVGNGGAIYFKDSNSTLTNCIIAENEAENGGGIYDFNSSPVIINCTISGNHAGVSGGGMYNYGVLSEPNVTNCILWDNDANDSGTEVCNSTNPDAEPDFSYCDIRDCNDSGSGNWNTNIGNDCGGNIDANPQFVAVTPSDGLVSYWKFDEGSGTTAHDAAGNNNGNIYDAQWTFGQIGGALSFAGDANYVKVPYHSSLQTENITISFWIKTTQDGGNGVWYENKFVFDKDAPGYGNAGWAVTLRNLKIDWVTGDDVLTSDSNVSDENWHHVVFIRGGNNKSICVDGNLDSSGTSSYEISNEEDLHIGAEENGTEEYENYEDYFNGLLDEVRIFNRALSASEIKHLYEYWTKADYHLKSDSPCINKGNPNGNYAGQMDFDGTTRVEAGRIDIGPYEGTWRIQNTTSGKWYEGIQIAVNEAEVNDTITVWPGIYRETVDFNGIACTLTSTDSNNWNVVAETVINAGGDPCDPNTYGHVIIFDKGEDSNTILTGFTITGGYVSGAASANNGGGIYCSGSSPGISKCIISDNIAKGNGGGIYDCNSSSPKVTNCIFSRNIANCGGGMYSYNSSPSVINCTLSRNYANDYGGGMYNNNSSNMFVKNSILWSNTAVISGNEIYNTPTGPIAHWKLDEGSGMVANDSASTNNGTVHGAAWTTGKICGALSFDGVNDYIDIGDKNDLDFGATDSFSIAAWVKSGTDEQAQIVSKRRFDAGGYGCEGYCFKIHQNKLYFAIEDADGHAPEIYSDTAVTDNNWHRVAAVRDVSADKLYLYLDGELDTTPVTDTTTSSLATSQSFWIGRLPYYDLYFDGKIDDVRIYNRALSAEEIQDNGSSEPNISYCDIKGCKDFNDVWEDSFGKNDGSNLNYAPYFKNSITGDYHLLNYSSCIDAGDPASGYSNEPNGGGGRIDIGAYGNTHQATIAGADSDNDGMPDTWELLYWPYDAVSLHGANDDPDVDDVNNLTEYHIGTNPDNNDTDADGMKDGWEYKYGLDPTDFADTYTDMDNDGLNNIGEYQSDTNPDVNDTDDDGMPDGWEVNNGLKPIEPNDANDDDDNDGLSNLQEYQNGLKPKDDDTDNDGMKDGWEITYGFDPKNINDADTDFDGDGYNNLSECLHNSNPKNNASQPTSNVTITVPAGVNSVQRAINASIHGDKIIVSKGIYYEKIDFNGKKIVLTSTDPNDWNVVASTIIDANGSGAVVTFDSGEDGDSVLTGFMLTGGQYGISCGNSSSPIISKCTVENNSSHGIYCVSGSPIVTNNKIGQNGGDGIYSSSATSPVIKNNWVYNNTVKGIELSSATSVATIHNNTIVYNNGKGIYVSPGSTEPNINNCIVWGNIAGALYGCNATFSCVTNGSSGTGNISSEPLFVNAGLYDYHIRIDSNCMNAGNPNGTYTGQKDIDSAARVQFERIDIGADEISRIHNLDSDQWYDTIQAAINEASDYDEIVVSPGTYYESIDFNGKSVRLQSTEPYNWSVVAATIIDSNGTRSAPSRGFSFHNGETSSSYIMGFTITGGYGEGYEGLYAGGGILCEGSSPGIWRCIIIDNMNDANNYDTDGGAIACYNGANPKIVNCIISDNSAYTSGAISCWDSNPKIIGCIINNNSAYYGGGIGCWSGSPDIMNCTFSKNFAASDGGGLYNDVAGPNLWSCIFWDNSDDGGTDESAQIYGSGMNVTYSCIQGLTGSLGGTGNIGNNPNFIDPNNIAGLDGLLGTADDGLNLVFFSPCIDKGNCSWVLQCYYPDIRGNERDISKNRIDMGAYENTVQKIICVDKHASGTNDGKSWTNAFTDLQAALTAARDGDEIWVAAETYKPTNTTDRSISFQLVKGVALYGGFEGNEIFRNQRDWRTHLTVLSGDIGTIGYDVDNSYHVVKGADRAVLDGFTITKGEADFIPTSYYSDPWKSADGKATSTSVWDGRYGIGDLNGGGMYNFRSSPVVANCIFSNNFSGAFGGGCDNFECSPTFTNCVFAFNEVFCEGGGISNGGATPRLTNCVFVKNGAIFEGGGIANTRSSPTLVNCTFSSNWTFEGRGEGMLNFDNSHPQVTNSIFWGRGNSLDFIRELWLSENPKQIFDWNPSYRYENSSTNISYSCIQDSYNGIANIFTDPYFTDMNNPAGPDGIFSTPDDGLRLKSSSPCIDSANGTVAPSTDILGLCRIDNSSVANTGTGNPNYADRGAYESCYGVDSDGDGMDDGFEIFYNLNRFVKDANDDADGDGMSNGFEYRYGLNPRFDDVNGDADGDDMPNKWECEHNLNPHLNDANGDADNDGISNIWEYTYRSKGLDPNNPNDATNDPDGDGFNNLVEYHFHYDPNVYESKPLQTDVVLPALAQVDPVKGEKLIFSCWLNKNTSNVYIDFNNADTTAVVRTISAGNVTAGPYQVVWDCNTNSGNIVAAGFYDVRIRGNGQCLWKSPEGTSTSYYDRSTGKASAYAGNSDVYRNIPVRISCNMLDWAKRKIDVVRDGHTEDQLKGNTNYRIYQFSERLLKPGKNDFDWYGRWGSGTTNSNKICIDNFDVYFAEPTSVKKGAVLVYYENLLTNLRCNPYRILALSDEASVISYDLAGSATVTIKVYDPTNYCFNLLSNQPQGAGTQKEILHGTSNPGTSDDTYISKEGIYRIEVTATKKNISETLNGTLTIGAAGYTAPAAPSGLYATAVSTNQVNLSWKDNSNTETSFKVERAVYNGNGFYYEYSEIAAVPANTHSYSDTGLTYNTTYLYRVRASDDVSNSPYSNEAYTTTPMPSPFSLPPKMPATIYYPKSSYTGQYTVSWSYVDGATLYELLRSANGGSTWTQVYYGSALSYSETVSISGHYCYSVRAVNGVGHSTWKTGTWYCSY